MYKHLSIEQLQQYLQTLKKTKEDVFEELRSRNDFKCQHPYDERFVRTIDGIAHHTCKICNKSWQ